MEGYAKVAQFMSAHEEFSILRRFRALNIQNLLYLQAEIAHIEAELCDIARHDARHTDREYHARDWWSLSQGDGEGDLKQWETVMELRAKLEKYNDSLLKQTAISSLPPPTRHDLGFLRSWFERPTMGSFPLLGLDRTSWDSPNEHDLVALNARQAPDRFTRWFTDSIIPKYHNLLGKRLKHPVPDQFGCGMYEYEESFLRTVVRVATTVIASLLPLCSVIGLYVVTNNALRLGIIVILSAFFSLALALMTNARKIEIFAATSAFAAVNVVYLTNGAPCSTPS